MTDEEILLHKAKQQHQQLWVNSFQQNNIHCEPGLSVGIVQEEQTICWQVLLYRHSGTNNSESCIPCKSSMKVKALW